MASQTQVNINQNEIENVITRILGKKLDDRQYTTVPKEVLRLLVRYYKILDEAPKIPITFGTTLYKVTDAMYLLSDAEYHHNVLINDATGLIWQKTNLYLSMLRNEVREQLKKHGFDFNDIYLSPTSNYYSFAYPNGVAVLDADRIMNTIVDDFWFIEKHFEIVINQYANGAIWVKVYSPSLVLQIIKNLLYYEHEEI